MRMRKAAGILAAAFVLLAVLAACSRENLQQIGLVGIEASFEIEPAQARAGEDVQMKAVFTGVELDENANVQFVVIADGEPTTVKHSLRRRQYVHGRVPVRAAGRI